MVWEETITDTEMSALRVGNAVVVNARDFYTVMSNGEQTWRCLSSSFGIVYIRNLRRVVRSHINLPNT